MYIAFNHSFFYCYIISDFEKDIPLHLCNEPCVICLQTKVT